MLKLDTNDARGADSLMSAIREPGKYIGIITRAEKLVSKNKSHGLGISFRSDDGQSADYLDLYTENAAGEKLAASKIVNAILACTKLKEAPEGEITIEKWNPDSRQREKVKVAGYPSLMGKRIGFLFQKELSTYNGEDKDKLLIYAVFEADTEYTASEILDRAPHPEKLEKMVQALMAHPVKDKREKGHQQRQTSTPSGFDDMEEIPF